MSDVTPVVIFGYNRADLLDRTLRALQRERVPAIYAFVDGPRTPADERDVDAVRRTFRSVDWTEITIVERERNLGLGRSIVAGVTDVLRRHDTAIVVEDDLVCSPGTYAWMVAALRHYADDARVMTVSAWTHPRVTPHGLLGAPFFCGRVATYFWATWSRAWAGMPDQNAREMLAEYAAIGGDPSCYGDDLPAMAAVEREKNIWAVRLIAHQLRRGGLCLEPAESLVRNVGFDARATNTVTDDQWDAPAAVEAIIPAHWPAPIEHPDCAPLWRQATREDDERAAAGSAKWTLPRRGARFAARRARRVMASVQSLPRIAWDVVTSSATRLARAVSDETRAQAANPARSYWDDFLANQSDVMSGRVFVVPDVSVHDTGETAYDVVVSRFALHAAEDDLLMLRRLLTMLTPGGVLLASFPCVAASPWDGREGNGEPLPLRRWYDAAAVRRLLSVIELSDGATIVEYGSSLGVAGYLARLPLSAVGAIRFRMKHPTAPILVCARIQRPLAWRPQSPANEGGA